MDNNKSVPYSWILRSVIVPSTALIGLCIVSFYNYLLFHSLSEVFSVIVAAGIFTIAWNSKTFTPSGYLLILGVAYLFTGLLDILHTLTYKGMGVIENHGANLSTQLWIAARYLESITFLVIAFFNRISIRRPYALFSIYLSITLAVTASIFVWKIFPDCFIEPEGLTPFKKVSEYVICFVLSGAAVRMYARRNDFDPTELKLIIASIMTMIVSELFFTLYSNNVYGYQNLAGHILKIVSFYLIYKAIIVAILQRPYSILFRDLKESEEALRQEKRILQDALGQIKTLKGMLPICANCKKIRDDGGYWNQIESYIKDHSEAEFSHSLCPDCARKLYPTFVKIEM